MTDSKAQACDLFVYGASPAGIGAAVAGARRGLRVIMAEPIGRIGGMVTGGLGRTDLGRPETVGGLFREYMNGVVRHYQQRHGAESEQVADCLGGERFEPQVAHEVLAAMVAEAGIEVRLRRAIAGARVGEGGIAEVEIRGPSGREQVEASLYVDASYEGDLLAAAGAGYRTGRESRREYGEEYAGHLLWDPRSAGPGEDSTGEADQRIQAYCFRLTVTVTPANRLPIERPPAYDRAAYDLLSKYLAAAPRRLKDVLLLGRLPNGKWDVNNWGFCWQSMDFIEANYDATLRSSEASSLRSTSYPEATWEQRDQSAEEHRRYQWGLLHFLQTDPSVPPALREEARPFGLCRDEFTDGGGWPEQLYVREARRLVGEHIFTEHDARRARRKPDAIAVGSYPMDSHATQWYRIGQPTPAPEGFFMCSVGPYEIPYRCLLAKSPRNLLVPVCLSATHAGYGTLRMEPVMMNLGMACGLAASLAIRDGTDAHGVSVEELQRALESGGQVIRAPER